MRYKHDLGYFPVLIIHPSVFFSQFKYFLLLCFYVNCQPELNWKQRWELLELPSHTALCEAEWHGVSLGVPSRKCTQATILRLVLEKSVPQPLMFEVSSSSPSTLPPNILSTSPRIFLLTRTSSLTDLDTLYLGYYITVLAYLPTFSLSTMARTTYLKH